MKNRRKEVNCYLCNLLFVLSYLSYCNEQVLLASVLVLITLIPACLLFISQHTDSAHAWLIVTLLKVASYWYSVCVINTTMRDSAFISYKSWGKLAQSHSGLHHSSGLQYVRPGLFVTVICETSSSLKPSITTAVCCEVTSTRKQSLRCSPSTLLCYCQEVSRADNTRQIHGTLCR